MNEQLRMIDHVKENMLDMAIKFGPKLFVALAILAIGYIVSGWLVRLCSRPLQRFKLEPPVRSLLLRIVQLFVLVLFTIIALQNLGVELLPLITGLGVAGAGIALAMQGVLSNIAAGLIIIFTQPFHIGDYLSINEEEGEVLDITLFNTTLGHPDRSRVIIPNRKIVGEIMHNYGKIRQLNLLVRVAYGVDLNQAFQLIENVLRANKRVLVDPKPIFGVSQLADSSVAINVNPWVNVPDYVFAVAEVNRAILETFRENGIEIPFPQREIRVLGAEFRTPAAETV